MSVPEVAPQPILKWVGGKRRQSAFIRNLFPHKVKTYHEIFFGGGAVFWDMAVTGRFEKACVSDSNGELVNLYTVVRDHPDSLIRELEKPGYVSSEARYYEIRQSAPSSPVERAARTIYLNKTGFNGLYRLNKSGSFNVPFGKRTDVAFVNQEAVKACSTALSGASIRCADFEEAADRAKGGDLVYMDSPYVPADKTQSFTSYDKEGFGPADHERCASTFRRLADRGVNVIASNRDTPKVRELYDGFVFHQVDAWRSVGSKGGSRKTEVDLVILGGPMTRKVRSLPGLLAPKPSITGYINMANWSSNRQSKPPAQPPKAAPASKVMFSEKELPELARVTEDLASRRIEASKREAEVRRERCIKKQREADRNEFISSLKRMRRLWVSLNGESYHDNGVFSQVPIHLMTAQQRRNFRRSLIRKYDKEIAAEDNVRRSV